MEDETLNYDSLFKTIDKIKLDDAQPKKYKGMGTLASEMISTYRGENTGFGRSKFDKGMNWDVSVDNNDIQGTINEFRADRQGWGTEVAAGVARIAVKAGSEIAKIPGYIGGSIAAIGAKDGEGWDTALNNRWIKTISEWNQDVNTEVLPVYVKKAVSEGNLWDNISSTEFWATDGADGIGYIASMFVPGAVFKMMGLGHKAMGLTAKGLSMVNGEAKLAGAVRTLTNAGITANKFDIAGTALVNSMLEAAAEGGNAMDQFDKQKPMFIDSAIKEAVAQGMSPEEAQEYAEKSFIEQKGHLGANIFKSNMGILLIPNLIQSKMIWGKAAPKSLTTGTTSVKNTAKNALGRIAGATASEGFLEEAGQMTVEHMYTDKANKRELGKGVLNDFTIGELADNYLNTISTTEGQKAMFLGAFLGGGMSAYQGYKGDKAERKQTNEVLELAAEKVTNFNKIVETDIYKRDEKGEVIFDYNNKPQLDPVKVVSVAKALQYTEDKNKEFEEAAINGDIDKVNEMKSQALTQLITPFITQGEMGIQALKQHLEETSKAEDLTGLAKPDEIKSLVNKAVVQATYMQDQYQAYQDFSRELINIQNSKATKEDIEQFYNGIADVYVNLKGAEYNHRGNLKSFEKQKATLLSDIGGEMIRTENIIDNEATDDMFKYEHITDPRVKLLNDKIESTKKSLETIDKFVNKEVWNSTKLNEAFKDIVDTNNNIRIEESKTQEYNKQLAEIDNIKDEKELNKIKTDNPKIQAAIDEKREKLKEIERLKQEAIDEENRKLAAEIEKNKGNKDPQDLEQPEQPENNPLPTGDISTDGNNNTDLDTDTLPKDKDNLTDKELDAQSSKMQPGAKLLSFNRAFNKVLDFVTPEWMSYERNGKDKSKDKVGFKINTNPGTAEDLIKALKMFDEKDFSVIQHLYDYLPINAVVNGVYTAIETKPRTKGSADIFNKESLPMRKVIIDALSNGQSIDELSTNIVKQFQGQLKVQPQYIGEDGQRKTPENSIKELQVFEGMTEEEIIQEIAQRAYYVDYDGILTNVINKKDKIETQTVHTGKGEIFLFIPQNNGESFPLKLNFKRINIDQGEAIYEIIKALSAVVPTIENPDVKLINLSEFITEQSSDMQDKLFFAIGEEIKLLDKLYPNENDKTVDKLLDLLIYQKSTNIRTAFDLDKSGNLNLGTLSSVNQVTKDELLNDVYKNEIIEFLSKKRHNILITKDEAFTFNDPRYVKYLLDNNILNTNAVVNEPTFQGYSTIYVNRDVKGVKEISDIEVKTKVEPELTDIEKRKEFIQSEIVRLLGERNNDKIVRKGIMDSNKKLITLEELDDIFQKWNDENGLTDLLKEQDNLLNNKVKQTSESETQKVQYVPKSEPIGFVATPTANGSFPITDMSSNKKSGISLYSLHSIGGDRFELIINTDASGVSDVVNYPHTYIDPVYDAGNALNQRATQLIVTKPTIVRKSGNDFIVESKGEFFYDKITEVKSTPKEVQKTENKELPVYISYTPKGKTTQQYVIKGTQIFNSKDEEVFKEDSNDRRKIFANLAIKQNRAKVVEDTKGVKYVVNNKGDIMSTTTGKIMAWPINHATRKYLLDKFNNSGDIKYHVENLIKEMMTGKKVSQFSLEDQKLLNALPLKTKLKIDSDYNKIVNAGKVNKDPNSKTDIKVETDFDFNSLDSKSQTLLIRNLTKILNVTLDDATRSMLTSNKKAVFDILITKAKAKNENIDNLIKRCQI